MAPRKKTEGSAEHEGRAAATEDIEASNGGTPVAGSRKRKGRAAAPQQKAAVPTAAVTALPQSLDLTAATSLRDSMAALLSDGDLALDAGAVERVSTPCAQVLLAAGRAATAAGASFKILNASVVFQTALADLGLQPEFSKWMV